MEFVGSHILSVDQFERTDIDRLFAVADDMVPYARRRRITRVLQGAILSNMFFEPSTRTRVSFGCAFNLLGGDVRETTEVKSSALAKGESLHDTARGAFRLQRHHRHAASRRRRGGGVRVGVPGPGDQRRRRCQRTPEPSTSRPLHGAPRNRRRATTRGETAGIDGLRIALVGDLKYGRAVHSLLKLLALFEEVSVHLVSPPGLEAPDDVTAPLRTRGHSVTTYSEMEEGIRHVDILYVTRTQEERFASAAEAARYRGLFRVNQEIYTEHCEPNTVIMHPLPRDSRAEAQELDDDLIANPNLAIFRQTDNGVLVRMALFAMVLDIADQVHDHALPVTWYTAKRTPRRTLPK